MAPKTKPPVVADAPQILRIAVERNMIREYNEVLEDRLLDEMEHATIPVLLDLSTITAMDSRGVALCVGLQKECQRRNLAFSIDVSPEIHKFFLLLKLDRVFTMREVARS